MGEVATRPENEQAFPPAPQLQDSTLPDPAISGPAIVDPAEPPVVFTSLVTGDADIVGLVAYSIYKQNKYDWLEAYSRLQGRMPEPAEVHSYLLGENTVRRLATYRQLAQAVLNGRGPDMPGAPPEVAAQSVGFVKVMQSSSKRIGIARDRSNLQLSSRAIVGLAITFVVLLILFWLMRSSASAAVSLSPGIVN